MLLLISSNTSLNKRCLKICEKHGVTAITALDCVPDDFPPRAAVLYSNLSDIPADSRLCEEIKKRFGDIPIIAAVRKSKSDPVMYRNIPGSDHQLDLPCDDDTLERVLLHFLPPLRKYELEFTGNGHEVLVCGYKITLTKVQYKMVRLITMTDVTNIHSLAAALGGITINNVTVQICKINNRSRAITGRKLIERDHDIVRLYKDM